LGVVLRTARDVPSFSKTGVALLYDVNAFDRCGFAGGFVGMNDYAVQFRAVL